MCCNMLKPTHFISSSILCYIYHTKTDLIHTRWKLSQQQQAFITIILKLPFLSPVPHTSSHHHSFLKYQPDYPLDSKCYTSMPFYGLCGNCWLTFLPSHWTDVHNEPILNSTITSTLSAMGFNQIALSSGRERTMLQLMTEKSSPPFQPPGTSLE